MVTSYYSLPITMLEVEIFGYELWLERLAEYNKTHLPFHTCIREGDILVGYRMYEFEF